ncbi:MAG: apolipoprotein N-acyltransferase [Actinomycetota bacterium]|nr:apolipoprotein N-acyltransferase [Actinomycetota bacterium]
MHLLDRPVAQETPATSRTVVGAPLWVRGLAAAAAGVGLLLSFPPYGVWWLVPVSVAMLTLALRGSSARRGAVLGLVAGLAFFVPLLSWTGVYVGPFPWLLLAVVQALYVAAMGSLAAPVTRLRGWPVLVAALWVAQEALRVRWPFGGFPWGRLAFSQADSPAAALAAVGGTSLVTFAVALSGTLLAAAVLGLACRRASRAAAWAVAAGIVLTAGVAVPRPAPAGPTVTVAVVQGNVPRLGLDFNAQREAVLGNHTQATHDLAADVRAGRRPAPDLVVWPENSSDIDPYADAGAWARIQAAVDDIGVPVLVGAVVEANGGRNVENTGIVWKPGAGPGDTYVKQHPVPFAEYIPMRRIARMVSDKVDLVRRDFVPGAERGTLALGPAMVGDVICFEVAYDGLVSDVVRGGAQLLVVQTNNATFGFTPQTEQQLAMSRLRAVEHGRTVLVAATSGVSAVVAPDGRTRDRAELFTRKVMVERVRLATSPSTASRTGAPTEAVLATVGVLGALVAATGRRRTRRP